MKKIFLILFSFLGLLSQHALGQYSTMYRVVLSDKGDSGYSIDRPGEFLSQKAIDRRQKQGFTVNETDLPIDPSYFAQLENIGVEILTSSKWVATVVVNVKDESVLPDIENLAFVKEIQPVWFGIWRENEEESPRETEQYENTTLFAEAYTSEDYGYAYTQNNLLNATALHQDGYLGEGISIAVMDGGFYYTDRLWLFDQERIKEAKNFTHEYGNVFEDSQDHGTSVLSCMLANSEKEMIGTAPYADYYLFKTEINNSEYPIEEDFWMAGVEYADSIGVDIISTSLGYTTFDDPLMNHQYTELDGNSIPASRLASMIASKGMVLCIAAGNEGNKQWGRIGVPSDGSDILTVGAVRADREKSDFSSYGYTEDNRVKPDVMAMGTEVYTATRNGIRRVNGTSVACPSIAGALACLWQALPNLTSLEIMDIVRRSADRYNEPGPYYGYGIPDFYQAYLLGKETAIPAVKEKNYIWVDSDRNRIHIDNSYQMAGNTTLMIYTSLGNCVMSYLQIPPVIDFGNLPSGVYIALLQSNDSRIAVKFIRR